MVLSRLFSTDCSPSCWGLVGTSTRESGGLRCSRPSLPGGQHSVCLHFRWKNLDSYMTPAMQRLMISSAWWMLRSYFENCSLKHLLQHCRKFRKRQSIHKVAPSLYLSFFKAGTGTVSFALCPICSLRPWTVAYASGAGRSGICASLIAFRNSAKGTFTWVRWCTHIHQAANLVYWKSLATKILVL